MPQPIPLLTVAIRREEDVLVARSRGRDIARLLEFSSGDITRLTTAISEIARNAYEYGKGGRVMFSVEPQANGRQDLVVRVMDDGPGIADVDEVLAPGFKSRTGMGVGLRGSRSLMDRFSVASAAGQGTTVTMAKTLPWSATRFGAAEAAQLAEALARAKDATPLGELQAQNQALLNALRELTERQAEVVALGIVADSARERAETAQLTAERALVVSERFMALTTHELRTPLGAMIGYLELLAMEFGDTATEKQKAYFERADRAAKHLLGITNDFLDMARGDAGRMRVARFPGAARHVMAEASALLAPQAAARNVTLGLAEKTDHVMYDGDVARIRQVLVNLLGNAVSFTPAGGHVSIIAERVTETPQGTALAGPGPWCVIRVEDSGPGIPADKIAHVFEPFVQLSSDGQAARKGSGLGLTVSRQLALLMGGDLTAASCGKGAVFSLWLPEPSCKPEIPVVA